MTTRTFKIILALALMWCLPGLRTGNAGNVNDVAAWERRQEQLDPLRPMDYFLLAEEIADASSAGRERDLARHLFALAGALAPQQLGRSAALALADLAEDELRRRELRALATLLEPAAMNSPAGEIERDVDAGMEIDEASALALSEAFGFYRRGIGSRAITRLNRAMTMDLLEALDTALPGGAQRFLDDCRAARGAVRPRISDARLEQMLRIEAGLLAGDDRSWSADLAITENRPLIDVDPTNLEAALQVDASRPRYRNGVWVP